MALPETEITKLRKPRTHSSTESSANTTKKGGRSNSIDDHDEICEVCEKGGDLLCCDTCTLVFHLKCIRPKLSVVPKGHWSCPHCIIDVSSEQYPLVPIACSTAVWAVSGDCLKYFLQMACIHYRTSPMEIYVQPSGPYAA